MGTLRHEEQLVFEAFMRCVPNFAGGPIKWQAGNNPPDIFCVDSAGKRIAVELGEWLREDQMHSGKKIEGIQASFLGVVKSETAAPPRNIAEVLLTLRSLVRLRSQDTNIFPKEPYKIVAEVDEAWPDDRPGVCSHHCHLGKFPTGASVDSTWINRRSQQGYFHRDFSAYACLERYLHVMKFFPGEGTPTGGLALPWISFAPCGGAYTPDGAVDSLLRLLSDKMQKYSDLHAKEGLDELYLIAYFNKGLRFNSPSIAPGFGFRDIAAVAATAVAHHPGPFQRIYLFNAIQQDLEAIQIWPTGSP